MTPEDFGNQIRFTKFIMTPGLPLPTQVHNWAALPAKVHNDALALRAAEQGLSFSSLQGRLFKFVCPFTFTAHAPHLAARDG